MHFIENAEKRGAPPETNFFWPRLPPPACSPCCRSAPNSLWTSNVRAHVSHSNKGALRACVRRVLRSGDLQLGRGRNLSRSKNPTGRARSALPNKQGDAYLKARILQVGLGIDPPDFAFSESLR